MKTSLAGSTSVTDGQTDRIAVAYTALAWNAFSAEKQENYAAFYCSIE